jgi:succinate dehydrogenase/fumarate reductase flavoprotein subunit
MSVNNLPGSKSNLVTPIGSPFNTGDGILMATRAGAKLWHMNCGEIYIMACKPASEKLGNAVTTIAAGSDKAIWVNRYGKRFLNECKSWGHTKRNLAKDDFKYEIPTTDGEDYADYPNMPFYWIFDDTLMKAGRLGYPAYDEPGYVYNGGFLAAHMLNRWSTDNQAELAKGWFVKADTIEELAKKIVSKDFFGRTLPMDPAALAKTVNDYNNYCTAGKDPEFARYPATLKPIKTPPYYAMELCAAMLNTNGGPVHNQYAQTLDTDGKPIPRLYSAGELGSIYGFLYQGAGNVPEALSMGRVAGEQAAKLTPWKASV